MSLSKRSTITLVVIAVLLAAGTAAFSQSLAGRALLRSRDQFIASELDPRVLYEPGMEEQATEIATALEERAASIERQHLLPFRKPFNVYVCSTQESFNAYMGAPPGATARGVKVLNDVFMSPLAFSSWRGDTHSDVLAHELSHLHVYQRLGHLKSMWKVPAWLQEGLAVMVSGGGGEGVTPQEARGAILSGYHFTPDTRGGLLRLKRASDYGIETFMFYRQSGLFVTHIRDAYPESFERFLLALQEDRWGDFGALFEDEFGVTVDAMWDEFEEELRKRARA